MNSLTALNAKHHGLGLIGAAVFIIGEMAGSGILTLPSAVANASKFYFNQFLIWKETGNQIESRQSNHW